MDDMLGQIVVHKYNLFVCEGLDNLVGCSFLGRFFFIFERDLY